MSSRLSLDRRRRLAVCLAGAAFVTAATWDVTVSLRSLYWGDVMLYFLPAVEFLRDHLLGGRIPLWNPHVLCGQPFVGNPQTSVLYLTTPMLGLMTGPAFLSANGIVHVSVAWVGVYRYCRWLRASRAAAVLAACTFAGGAPFLGRLQFPTMIQAMAWMPWLALLSSRLGRTPDRWRMLALAVVISLSIGAGHAQVTFMSLLLASAVALAAPITASRLPGVRALAILRAYMWWLAALVIGAALAAASWLPVADLVRCSARPDLSLLKADRFTIGWVHLVGLVWPAYMGNARTGDYWAPGNMWEPAVYVGAAPLALAVIGAAAYRRCSVARLHAALAIVSLWLAAGVWGGLYLLAYFALPGMGVFHDPARFAIVWALSAAVLAGRGLDRIRSRLGKTAPLIVVGSVGTILVWTARLTPTVNPDELVYRPRVLALGTEARYYTPFRQDTWDRYVSYKDYGAESGRYVHELTDTVLPNLGMRYGLSESGGYEPVPIRWAVRLEGLMRDAVVRQSPLLSDFAAMTWTRYLHLPVGTAVSHPSLAPVSGLPSVLRVADRTPAKARAVSRVRVVPDPLRAMEALERAPGDRDWAIVNRPMPNRIGLYAGSEPADVPRVRWLTANRIVANLDATASARLLILPVTYAPGWKARVDGRPTPIVQADAAFLGVPIAAGSRTVAVRYEPETYRVALFVTLMSAAGIVFCAVSALPGRLSGRRRQVH